ncbi:MAG: DUF134 domain-containing protein [Patescibacteria group bacterium]
MSGSLFIQIDSRIHMVRPRIKRLIDTDPHATYFKPRALPLSQLKEVELETDELEAIRLCDFLKLGQIASAEKMGVSQSTFQRIITSARSKTAEALTEGKAIKVVTDKDHRHK